MQASGPHSVLLALKPDQLPQEAQDTQPPSSLSLLETESCTPGCSFLPRHDLQCLGLHHDPQKGPRIGPQPNSCSGFNSLPKDLLTSQNAHPFLKRRL